MFFESWYGLGRVFVIGVCAYAALVVLLRVSGKRTLSKMNAFDFVVTVALGSTLSSVLLSKDVALAEGLLAMALLVLLQFVITWASVRWEVVSGAVKAEPALLFYDGRYLHGTLRDERVTPDEIEAQVRKQGYASAADVRAVVLETDGSLAVVAEGTLRAGLRVQAGPA